MRLVSISKVPLGARLGRDILTGRADGAPLLRAGVMIDQRYLDALKKTGIHAVYVDDADSEGIAPEPLVAEETRLAATRQVASAYEDAKRALVTGRPLGKSATDALADVVAKILREIENSGSTALVLSDLACADAYTFQHSIDVTAIGLLLGQRMFTEHGWLDYRGVRQHIRRAERLSRLGMGLLLHDIGKLAIGSDIVTKPTALTEAEWKIMRTHPRLGVELLRDTSAWCPLVQAIVLRHHERWDGSGYPDGRRETEIHEMARIAAVADVYDAITSERPYAAAAPAHVGVRAILEGSGTQFDPTICNVFRRMVAPFPPGIEVKLTDGRRGVVVSVPEQQLDRPVVRLLDGVAEPCEVSLLEDPSLRIVGWDEPPARAPATAVAAA
jgi:HD-GYP domain-containing protein (c-di-GMP phosphodiesterase class II)